jgi:uncharacterized caspase-like protein
MPDSAQKPETNGELVKGELTIPIPAEDAEISIVAANRFTKSEPETRSLQWKGPKAAGADKPDLYLLAIGIGHYPSRELHLTFPARDAEDIAVVLKAQMGLLYKKVEAKTLLDDAATHDAVLQAFQWIKDQKTKAGDSVIFFIAGHGAKQRGQYYFLPYDADIKNLGSTAISAAEIEAIIGTVPARAVLFADTCHSGSLFAKGITADVNGAVNELASPEHGIVVFAASTGGQRSWEDSAWGNGAFTKALVEGLSGRGRLGREITVAALESYISRRVIQITGGRQTPATAKPRTIPDFPIALQSQ